MQFHEFYTVDHFPLSLEIFPPKSEKGIENLMGELQEMKSMQPSFISVTYGAMGTTRDLTGDLALRISRDLDIPAAFHFTCVGTSREEIRKYVQYLKSEGLDLIVALRGDPPQGLDQFVQHPDGFAYANELVGYLKELNSFSIAVAGYPEGHVESKDLDSDLENLKRKVDAGADIVMTQLFFNNDDYFKFVEKAQRKGIQVPIVPGIMPILNVKQIEKITSMCGSKLPSSLHQKLMAVQEDSAAMREIGIEHAIEQSLDLRKQGAPGIHFFTLNKAYSVMKIVEALR